MHLYQINPSDGQLIHVVARTYGEAADLYVTWRFATGGIHQSFTVDLLPIEKLIPEQQVQVRSAFSAGFIGISHFDEETGWSFSPPMWLPLFHATHFACPNVGGKS